MSPCVIDFSLDYSKTFGCKLTETFKRILKMLQIFNFYLNC
jgi:hypothetical protein